MRPDNGDSSGCRLRGACSVRPEPEATAATEQHSQVSSLIAGSIRQWVWLLSRLGWVEYERV